MTGRCGQPRQRNTHAESPVLDTGDWVLLAQTLADRGGARVRVGMHGMVVVNNQRLDGTLTVHFSDGVRAAVPADRLILVAI